MTDRKRSRQITSVGPYGKNTGNVDQLIKRYETLARDEQDIVRAEQFGQHAEHYRRLKTKRK